MTGVIGRPYLKRQDITLAAGVDQRIGYRWKRGESVETAVGVDLYGYTATAALASSGGDLWLELTPVLHEDGLVELVVSPEDTTGPQWAARTQGIYRIELTSPEGEVTALASGYVTMITGGVV